MVEIILREVRNQKLDIRVDALESAHWELLEDINGQHFSTSPVYVDTLFSNTYIDENIDSYSLHSYRTKPNDKKAFADYFTGMYRGKKLHMSEWCETKSGRDYGMDSALTLAKEVIDDLVLGNVSSWQYWIAVSKYDWHDGLIYVNDKDKTIQPTKRLWVMGNFSRFIRPGYRRVNAYCDEPNINVLAAQNPQTGNLVVVACNFGHQEILAKLHLVGITIPVRCDVWETSQNYNLRKMTHTHMDLLQVFPARSVVTLVFNGIQKI